MISLARVLAIVSYSICFVACSYAGSNSPINLDAEYSGDSVKLVMRNNGEFPIHYSSSPLTVLKNPDLDLFYVFSGARELRDQCVIVDMVPSDRRVLEVGESAVFNENVVQLSESFCLNDGQKYSLQLVYGKLDGSGYRIVLRSNKIDFVARTPRAFDRRYPMRLSPDGEFFEFEKRAEENRNN